MAVEDPGELQVTCDECGEEASMPTTEYVGSPPSWGVDESTIAEHNWEVRDTEILCPKCCGKQEPKPKKKRKRRKRD